MGREEVKKRGRWMKQRSRETRRVETRRIGRMDDVDARPSIRETV